MEYAYLAIYVYAWYLFHIWYVWLRDNYTRITAKT